MMQQHRRHHLLEENSTQAPTFFVPGCLAKALVWIEDPGATPEGSMVW